MLLRTPLKLLLLILSLGAGLPASACPPSPGGATCGGTGPASQGNSSATNQGAGNPINVTNGNKYQKEVELPALPGVLGLEIVRYYNSAYAGPSAPNGILGHGWKLSYETDLYAIGNSLQIVQADGTRIIFNRDSNNPAICASTDPTQGKVLIRPTRHGDEYTWVWPNGRRLNFDSTGKLVQILAPTGEFVSLQRDPQGLLVKVTDPQGRELHLNYLDRQIAKAGNRFRGVQSIDSPVGRFGYEYGSAAPKGSTVPKADLLANLIKVSLPTHYDATKSFAYANRGITSSSISRLYHYEDPRHPTLLTGITVSGIGSDGQLLNQRISTWAYDADGRGILSYKGSKPAPGKPGIEQVELDHSTPGKTLLTNSLGQTTTYTHAIIGEQARLLEVSGAGCATCNETNVKYTYDQLGRMTGETKLTPAGQPVQTTRTGLDAYGRPSKVSTIDYVNGQPQPAQLQVRYAYAPIDTRNPQDPDPFADQPILIARPSVVHGQEHRIRITYNSADQPTQVTETGWTPGQGGAPPTPLTRTTTYTYTRINGRSLLAQIDGPLQNGKTHSPADSDITRYTWDKRGNFVTAMTTPGGFTSTVQYDEVGRIATVSNAQGFKTSFTYDARNQLIRLASSGAGWAQAGIKPDVQSYRYDALGNLVEVGSSMDKTFHPQTRQAFDVAGRLLWQAEALGILKSASYDTEGHLLSSTVQTRSFEQTERYRYDNLNRLIQVADNTGTVRNVVYGQHRTAGSHTASAFHILKDDFGREVSTTSASQGTISKRYNAADQLIEQTNAKGDAQTFAYDLTGQRIRYTITPKTGTPQTTTWRYENGRLVEIIDPAQTERIRYDERGQPVSKTVTLKLTHGAEATYITRYTYNADGSLTSQSLPDGTKILYERNGQGQVVAVSQQTSPWTFFGWGEIVLVKDLERDLIGLRSVTYGNGIRGQWQRSKQGVLARVVYTQPEGRAVGPLRVTTVSQPILQPGYLDGILNAFLPTAHAQTLPPQPNKLPGALGIPTNPQALFDARLLYDEAGNVLLQKQQGQGSQVTQAYAYDGHDQLIAAQTASRLSTIKTSARASPATVWRYYYDRNGNRVLAQEQVPVTEMGQTRNASYHPDSNALITPPDLGREYVWNAQGQLTAIRQENKELAHYRYNYRGLRVSKQVGAQAEYTLYNDQRQRIADLDAQGKITRQYIWLADHLIATLDAKQPKALQALGEGYWQELTQTVQALWNSFTGHADRLAFVHVNHLGAPITATDQEGQILWQADYAPYGKLIKTSAANQPVHPERVEGQRTAYTLAMRYSGQWEDAESGLYYNDLRYYAPQSGRYLSPDPLGRLAERLGSPNAYAYVNNNPLSYIDPWGLMLFAFDGTGNGDPTADKNLYTSVLPGNSASNVWNFYQTYQTVTNDPAYYITGIGTTNEDMTYIGNMKTGDGFDQRLGLANTDLMNFIESPSFQGLGTTINIDVVGFSRGAAEARAWVNQILASTTNGLYTFTANNRSHSACINFRFEGLFDTVPHLGLTGGNNGSHNFSIPTQVQYAVQAVALNENRGGLSNFNAYSIMSSPGSPNTANRIEQGFIGSHSDIGGGYGIPGDTTGKTEGDLSNVAFTWMYDQAKNAGVPLKPEGPNLSTVNSPILHDEIAAHWYYTSGRTVTYGNGTTVPETSVAINSAGTPNQVTQAWTQQYITLHNSPCATDSAIVGMVDMKSYGAWLASNGVNLTSSNPSPATQLCN